jgi:cell fate regulator YaaT (PSP1 superfamily)
VFNINTELEINNGDRVVVESIRGLELAYACPSVKKDEEQEEVKSIVRIATEQDTKNACDLEKQTPKIVKITNELIAKYKLEMKLVSISFTLDGSKVVINYVCEDRVDFRELVKDLASQLKLRIELRQIGIRDQAKIVGGIGFCGKECCCKKYLNDFDKVSIKMAKSQGLSLNPTKISGICGRLMCCLSYESEYYSEISAKMPKINGRVKTKDGIGVAVYNNLLKQKVTVKIDNGNEIKQGEYDLADIEILPRVPVEQPKKDSTKGDSAKKEKTNLEDKQKDNQNKNQNKKKHNNFKKKEHNDKN